MFHVGQKVVCVYDEAHPDGTASPARLGEIYTVSATWSHRYRDAYIQLIQLIEAPAAPRHGGYAADRFRPLVSRKTDISVFHEILREANARRPEPVE